MCSLSPSPNIPNPMLFCISLPKALTSSAQLFAVWQCFRLLHRYAQAWPRHLLCMGMILEFCKTSHKRAPTEAAQGIPWLALANNRGWMPRYVWPVIHSLPSTHTTYLLLSISPHKKSMCEQKLFK